MKVEELSNIGCINNDFKNPYKSTGGLGLFVSNILAQLLVNSINTEEKTGLTVFSEFGKGTCFTFRLKCDMNEGSKKSEINPSFFSIYHKTEGKANTHNSQKFESIFSKENYEIKSIKVEESSSMENEAISTRSIITKKRNFDNNNVNAKFINNKRKESNQCNCPKVLVVDDVLFNIEVLRKLFIKRKIIIDCAANGLDAVVKVERILLNNMNKKFCNSCHFFKLIIMDIDMPYKNGIEATKEIKNLLKNSSYSVDIVGLSAFHQDEIKKQGIEAGMNDYIVKPISSIKIDELIKTYINK